MPDVTVHATAVSISGEAILIRGEPGAGKSTLAMELIEMPGSGLGGGILHASLISDDQTNLTVEGGSIWCSAPSTLLGLLEVRGLGILRVKPAETAALRLIIDLVCADEAPRLPEVNDEKLVLLGIPIRLVRLDREGKGLASRVRAAFLRL